VALIQLMVVLMTVLAKIIEPTAIETKNPHQKINPAIIESLFSVLFPVHGNQCINKKPKRYNPKCDEKINQFHNYKVICYYFYLPKKRKRGRTLLR